ncbi:LolA family protein [Georgenia muralis]
MRREAWTRWVPAIVVPAAIGAGSLVVAGQAGAAVDLPDLTAEEVLVLAAEHEVESFSGAFEQTSDLGLPELPGGMAGGPGPGSTDPAAVVGEVLAALTQDRSGRVYADGPERVRVQLLDRFDQVDLVRSGTQVWLYDSAENTATHLTLPAEAVQGGATTEHALTPEEVAARFVAAAEDGADVTVGEDRLVAGRPAYELVVDPRTEDTLVDSVSLAIDAETGFPLAVAVRAVGQQDPALSLAYTSFDPVAPDPGLFAFEPPEGAEVVEKELPEGLAGARPEGPHGTDRPPGGDATHALPFAGTDGVRLDGSGWDAVLVAATGADLLDDPLLDQLTTETEGGRALTTSLLTVLLTDDGRVLAGAVPLERLLAVAAS